MRTLRAFPALMLLTLLPLLSYGVPGEPTLAYPEAVPVCRGGNFPIRDGGDDDSVYYSYGFENGMNGWTTVDLTNPGLTWHSSESNAINGRSFWAGSEELEGYDNHWLQYIVTPSLNLQGRQNLRLTFDIKWACEDPANGAPADTGETAGYDGWDGCNVWVSTNNGQSWEFIRPTQPAYNYQSLFSFGFEWEMGHDIPGWCGFSDGVQQASFDLSRFAQNNVKIRWAFCTDPAWNTADDANAVGMVIDNLVVRDGNGIVWQNNGDAIGDMSRDQGPVSGDHWELTQDDAHTGNFSAHCPIGNELSNALVSPAIEIPLGGWYTYFEFWVRADTRRPNSNPDEDNSLDDFFEVYISTNGLVWDRICYDYGRERQDENGDPEPDPEWVDEFHYFGPDVTFNQGLPEWKVKLNVSQFAGEEIFLRWRVKTDDDVEGNQGAGIFIDDMRVLISEMRENDVGVEAAWIKYPNAMGFTTGCRADIRNYGMNNQPSVLKYWRIDETPRIPIAQQGSIPSDTTIGFGFSITPNRIFYADSTTIRVYARVDGDETYDNDTAFVTGVVFYPANIWRLGYDSRSYALRSDFAQGSGPAIKFTPVNDQIRGNFDVEAIRVRWNRAQLGTADVTTRMHIYRDVRGEIGAELHSEVINVTDADLIPGVHVIDVSDVQAVQGMSTNFWVWFEILRDDTYPQIVGDEQEFGAGHYFSYDGNNSAEANIDWQVHAILMPAGFSQANQLTAGRAILDFDDVSPGASKTMRVALFNGGTGEVTLNSVTANDERFTVEVVGPMTLKIGDMAQVYVTLNAVDASPVSARLVIESSDNSPPRIPLIANGGDAVEPEENSPVSFHLDNAYPNPFNSTTVIPFTLASSVETKLAVYDLSGREVAVLVASHLEAGAHAVSFEAGHLSTGVYLYRLDAGPYSSIRKVIVVK